MPQLEVIHDEFVRRWDLLAGDDDLFENWRRWENHFEILLTDVFWDVFEDGKRTLQRDPSRFAHHTLLSWCLAADPSGVVLCELGDHCSLKSWLEDLEKVTRSELNPEDFAYRPPPQLCLADFSRLQPRQSGTSKMLSQMHHYLNEAVADVLAGRNCATIEEAVARFPALRGITAEELKRFRGNRGLTVGTAARELLSVRLRHLQPSTLDRFFRPTEFVPR